MIWPVELVHLDVGIKIFKPWKKILHKYHYTIRKYGKETLFSEQSSHRSTLHHMNIPEYSNF